MPRAAAHSTSAATLPRLLTRRRPQHHVLHPSPSRSRSTSPSSPTLGFQTLTSRHLAHAARHDSGQPVSTSCYSTTTATGPSTLASTNGAAGIETERDFGMNHDDGVSVQSSPTRTKHRPGPPTPPTPPMARRGYSDETPAGRIKHARHSPTFSSHHRGKARGGTFGLGAKQDDCADDADDEQQLYALTTPRHRKRTSKEEITSPSRKHRFKRLITKGSKLNLDERCDSIISSPNQELCMPPLGTTPIIPSREISSPTASRPLPPRHASPMMSSPPPTFELRPQGQLSSRSQYGFDIPHAASPTRGEKAARILGEEVKASGKAARVLGIEQKAFPETKSSTSSLPPRNSSPSGSERSLQITLSTPRPPPPATPKARRHDRQRSLSGPAAFASLEIPITTTEASSSSLASVASCSSDDIHVCFHFRSPCPLTMTPNPTDEPASRTATSAGMGLGLGLATPPPSPPSVPLRPPEAAIEDDAPSEDAQLSRGPNRSKVASVASSTYSPSVYEGSDDVGVRNRHRLTLDSIRFSSAFEGVTGFSTSSGTGSQSQHSLPVTRSSGSNPPTSARSSLQPQVVQRPPLSFRSISTPVMPNARHNTNILEQRYSNQDPASPTSISSPLAGTVLSACRSETDLAAIAQEPPAQSTPRPQPQRMSTFGSVASARTKKVQRSVALAALEGQPRLLALGPPPQSGQRSISYGDGDGGGPSQPPPQGCLPPLPFIPTPPTSPPHASRSSDDPLRALRNSESFLDFGVSSGDDEDPGEQHRPLEPWSSTDSNHRGRPAPDVPDEVSVLSTRFSSLPLRQLELPRRQLAALYGGDSGSGKPFLRGLEMPRSRSSPLLRLETSPAALKPKSSSPLSESARKGSRALESILSLSSDDEDGDGSGEDLTAAFPRPPGI